MSALGMTDFQAYAATAILAVVLVIGGGKLLYDNTDTGLANSAFALSKQCQRLKRTADHKAYIDCIRKLNMSLEKLQNRGILDVKECKPYHADENSAICPTKGSGRIIVTLPEIVALAKKNGVTKRSVDQVQGM